MDQVPASTQNSSGLPSDENPESSSSVLTLSKTGQQLNQLREPNEKIESSPNTTLPSGSCLFPNEKTKKKLSEELKGCTTVLEELLATKNEKYAWPFYKSFEATFYGLYDKGNIKTPIDLEIIKSKLDNMKYSSAEEFTADINLMFSNFFGSEIKDDCMISMAKELQTIFETEMSKVLSDCSKMDVVTENESRSEESSSSDSDDSEDLEYKKQIQEFKDKLALLSAEMNKLVKKRARKKKKTDMNTSK